jgi:hypothetical protein
MSSSARLPPRPDHLGFYDWGDGSILASRDASPSLFSGYTEHLEKVVREHQLQPTIFLPKRGEAPTLPYKPSWPRRMMQRIRRVAPSA